MKRRHAAAVVATTLAAATVVLVCGPTGTAWANGFLENRPYQFDTPSDKAAKVGILDLIERKKGGYYDAFQSITNVTNFNEVTTNIDGDQINCNVTSSAVGNSHGAAMTATVASPTGVSDADIFSEATGNNANNTDEGGGTIGNTQGNAGSDQTSGVDNSGITSSVGSQNVAGSSDQILNSAQSNSGSSIGSTISGSTACLNP